METCLVHIAVFDGFGHCTNVSQGLIKSYQESQHDELGFPLSVYPSHSNDFICHIYHILLQSSYSIFSKTTMTCVFFYFFSNVWHQLSCVSTIRWQFVNDFFLRAHNCKCIRISSKTPHHLLSYVL